MTDPRSRRAVEVAESFADGQAGDDELALAHSEACAAASELATSAVRRPGPERDRLQRLHMAARAAVYASAAQVTLGGNWLAAGTSYFHLAQAGGEYRNQANLIRDIFGRPLSPEAVEPAWLAWNNGTVPAIARCVYDERRFEDLPILADALEDAGCTDAALLDHCRGPGPHVRGCWAVDLLLGKA